MSSTQHVWDQWTSQPAQHSIFGLLSETFAVFSYQWIHAPEPMETLLLITLLMVAVDGPVTPSELSQDLQNGILVEDTTPTTSAWTGGPENNMWTNGEQQAENKPRRGSKTSDW